MNRPTSSALLQGAGEVMVKTTEERVDRVKRSGSWRSVVAVGVLEDVEEWRGAAAADKRGGK